MPNLLLVNRSPSEVRVALLENGATAEVYVERRSERGVVGNIYRGKVVRVLPGMQAAFVEVGLERTGFLYVADALPRPPVEHEDPEGSPEHDEGRDASTAKERAPLPDITSVLSQGQDILVQVQKEPLGTKGARLTRHVTLPGRYLVFMPESEHVGVSRRIASGEERGRLHTVLEELQRELRGGLIARTAAEGVDAALLRREAQVLAQMWQDVAKRAKQGKGAKLLYEDLDLTRRATRDLLSDDVSEILVDNAEDYARLRAFVDSFAGERAAAISLYDKPEPIFDHYGVEVEIARALERRVWLKSGGYIVIDQAEALTVVDVNSGRFVGKSSLEDTITQINLEAVKEIAFQLRLRNIGGIVIIDFIDMQSAANREKVLGALQEALSRDKAKSTIVRMSEIGLVEMTRKRVRESLGHVLTEACPYCKGRGAIKSQETVVHEILRAAARLLAQQPVHQLLVNMHPELVDYLYAAESEAVEAIEARYGVSLIPVAREGYHRERYELVPVAHGSS